MQIKNPSFSRLPQLQKLWHQAFRESMGSFLRTAYSAKRCLVAEVDGKVAAALYWFDLDYKGRRLAYLYAIATKESHRGQGIGKTLVEAAHSHLKGLGYAGAVLVPANEGLFAFYKKCGYTEEIPGFLRETPAFSGEKVTWQQYAAAREKLLPLGGCCLSKEVFRYLDTYCDFYVGEGSCCCVSHAGKCQEVLPYTPTEKPFALFLPFAEGVSAPSYFALPID